MRQLEAAFWPPESCTMLKVYTNYSALNMVEFIGGLLSACAVVGYLLFTIHRVMFFMSPLLMMLGIILHRAVVVSRPLHREKVATAADTLGRLTESIGGARVVKGYHAEGYEARIFRDGSHRVLASSLRIIGAVSYFSLAWSSVLGIVGVSIVYFGGRLVISHSVTIGSYFQYSMLLPYLIAPLY